MSLVALAAWGFVGAEFVCPLVEETHNPEQNIPKAMLAGTTLIMVIYVFFCLGALKYLPQETLSESSLPHHEYAVALFGDTGRIFLSVAAITATCSTVNSTLAAVPRMLYGMAGKGQTFRVLGEVHAKYATPWVSIIVIAALTGLPILIFGTDADAILTLLTGAAIAWLLAYIIAYLDVIMLRIRFPKLERPFKSPLYPLPQIVGIVGMAYAVANTAPKPELEIKIYTIAGSILALVSVLAACWVKLVMKKDLFTPEPLKLVDISMQKDT